jgi:endonuclease G
VSTHLRSGLAAALLLALSASGRAADGDEHLFLGNPSGATADRGKPDNFLVKKRQYALSYNAGRGGPNWVSWRLSKSWLGKARRANAFAPDTTLPAAFFAARPDDYRNSGFDKGHLCPAADRSASREDIDATFLMTNMVPQAPDLNRIAWEKLESYCRDQALDGDEDLYIIAGAWGEGGTGSEGKEAALRVRGGKVTVPAKCWKVVLVVPAGTADPGRLTAAGVRAFAAVMPNGQGLDRDWRKHAVKVADVEALTGYAFFDRLPADLAKDLRSREPETRARRRPAALAKGEAAPKKGEKGGELSAFEEGCVVGNRVSKIYHARGGRGYAAARKSKNAVFYGTAADAERAGLTRAKR